MWKYEKLVPHYSNQTFPNGHISEPWQPPSSEATQVFWCVECNKMAA